MKKIALIAVLLQMLTACAPPGYQPTGTRWVSIKEEGAGIYSVHAFGGARESTQKAMIEAKKKCAELGGSLLVDESASLVPYDKFEKNDAMIVFRCVPTEDPKAQYRKG